MTWRFLTVQTKSLTKAKIGWTFISAVSFIMRILLADMIAVNTGLLWIRVIAVMWALGMDVTWVEEVKEGVEK